MTAQISFNPVLTTNASGSFNTSSSGYIQGVQLDDPSARFTLAGGILATTETIPMWGGVGISEFVAGNATAGYIGSPGGPNSAAGGQIFRATALTGAKALTGFSVFNQAHGMINTPQSPVPLAGSLMQVNFVRLGSGARVTVKCDPLLAALSGTDIITQPVAWDFVNQLLIPQVTSDVPTLATYNVSGLVTVQLTTGLGISPGDSVTVSGLTGSGSFAAANGTFTAAAGTTGTTLTYTIAPSLTMTLTTSGSPVVTTGAALACKVLDINSTNSMTVTYDPSTGFATWDRNGSTAVILI